MKTLIVAHKMEGKSKNLEHLHVLIFSQSLVIFISPFNPIFHFHSKDINFFEIGPKLTFLGIVLSWNYFFGGGIPSFLENSYQECEETVRSFLISLRLVPHNVNSIPFTLWPTMWPECEENVSLNEDAYCLLTSSKSI